MVSTNATSDPVAITQQLANIGHDYAADLKAAEWVLARTGSNKITATDLSAWALSQITFRSRHLQRHAASRPKFQKKAGQLYDTNCSTAADYSALAGSNTIKTTWEPLPTRDPYPWRTRRLPNQRCTIFGPQKSRATKNG